MQAFKIKIKIENIIQKSDAIRALKKASKPCLRTELNRIGNNINQIAYQMNAHQDGRVNESAIQKLEELKSHQLKLHQILDEIADKL